MTTATTSTHHLSIEGIGPIEVRSADGERGSPFVLLHGGAGPQSVGAFADLLAETEHACVITPTHPGFGGTPRPATLATIRGLAALYVALLDELDLADVTVIGNSIGGWIAAEMALLGSPRIARLVLVDATGIEVPGHPDRRRLLPDAGPGVPAELPQPRAVPHRPLHPAPGGAGRRGR